MNGQLFVAVLVVAIVGTRGDVLEDDDYLERKRVFVNDNFVLFKNAIEGNKSEEFNDLLNTTLISQVKAVSRNLYKIGSKIDDIQYYLSYTNEEAEYTTAVRIVEDNLNTELINLLREHCYKLDIVQELIVKVLNKTTFPSKLYTIVRYLTIAKGKIIALLNTSKDIFSNVSLAVANTKILNWSEKSNLVSDVKDKIEIANSQMDKLPSAFPDAMIDLECLKGALAN